MIDQLTVTATGQDIKGWQDISITRSIESFPSSFQLGLTENYPHANEVIIVPGTVVYIKIGNDLVLTGYCDRYNADITPETHDVQIQGRSYCEDLVDADALFDNSVVAAGQTITQIATMLCAPFGITVKNNVDDGPPIPSIVINLGEKPYEIIEKLARWVGLLVYDDVDGNLILDRAGSITAAGGFQQGHNIQSASAHLQVDQRFTEYFVVWQAVNDQADISATGNQHGYAKDVAMLQIGRVRPHYIVSTLTDSTISSGSFDLGQRLADWECNRRIGRSQSVTLTTDSWRDKNGALWRPNSIVYCDIPVIKMSQKNWIIATVTYSRNATTGTTAQLTLMPPDAFLIEPISLGGVDQDILQGIRAGTATAPTNLAPREGLA